jgi:hypothetical protein
MSLVPECVHDAVSPNKLTWHEQEAIATVFSIAQDLKWMPVTWVRGFDCKRTNIYLIMALVIARPDIRVTVVVQSNDDTRELLIQSCHYIAATGIEPKLKPVREVVTNSASSTTGADAWTFVHTGEAFSVELVLVLQPPAGMGAPENKYLATAFGHTDKRKRIVVMTDTRIESRFPGIPASQCQLFVTNMSPMPSRLEAQERFADMLERTRRDK